MAVNIHESPPLSDHLKSTPIAVRTSTIDDVAVALRPLEKGECVSIDGVEIVLRNEVPKGHKFAVRPVGQFQLVHRYRAPIGRSTMSIAAGEHVHTHNLETALSGEQDYAFCEPRARTERTVTNLPTTFDGYLRSDGSAGTRNEIWILPTVGCVGRLGERLARHGQALLAACDYETIDGVHAFNHPFGCSQLGSDLDGTAAILASLAVNPNAGGVLLLGLGCESNQLDALLERIPNNRRDRLQVLRAQSEQDEFAAGEEALKNLIAIMSHDVRRPLPLSQIRLGVKCGGSDAMSGLTANPLIGLMADAVTDAGGTAVLTEIPEIFGAETLLLERTASQEVFDSLCGLVNSFKRYFLDHGEPVSENPSPGNIAGGITTLEEKSLGAVQKGGLAIVKDVLRYGGRVAKTGLSILEGPGNDAVSTTALAAAGVTITLFSTGRGTPLGSPVPTLKIASNSGLAEHKPGWIDFNGGRCLEIGMDAAAQELLTLIVKTASGEPARNEVNDERAIGIWKRGVTL